MVSLKTVLTVGAIGAAAIAFIKLGGASGIGQRIGSGLSGFGSGIISGISGAGETIQSGITTSVSGGINEFQKLLDTSGGAANEVEKQVIEDPFPISTEFKTAVESGAVTPAFAAKYSFLPPPPSGSSILDVSKTFKFISTPPSSLNLSRRAASNYGGYGSQLAQDTALSRAIEASAAKYPQYFG